MCLGATFNQCQNNLKCTLQLLEELGFIINFTKSLLQPAQRCQYLGFIFDSKIMSVEVPSNKRQKILSELQMCSKLVKIKIRNFA